ncbi:MAG: YjbH domain-containing protein [Jannaschia sp.]
MSISAATFGLGGPVFAQDATRPLSVNSYGAPGLIDMPSAQMQPDGELVTSLALLANGTARTQVSFQITPRLQGVFRYSTIPDFLQVGGPGGRFERTYDRSFDIRYQLFREGRIMPAVTVGLQDFGGTSLFSGEYVVATKTFRDRLSVTGGIGWGRLGTNGSFSNPLGALSDRFDTRVPYDPNTTGGQFSADQWFRGPAALFAGVEYRPNDRWTLKAEYSSDAYVLEEARGIVDLTSGVNLGIDYQVSPGIRLGAYALGGSEIGATLQFAINPKRPLNGSGTEEAARPVAVRPSQADAPAAWTTAWVGNAAVERPTVDTLAALLEEVGLILTGYDLDANRAQVRFRNPRYGSQSQAIGRAARAMTAVLPASVETFVIVPESGQGLASAAVVLRRSDLEALEYAPNAAAEIEAVAGIVDAQTLSRDGFRAPDGAFPRFSWNLGPYVSYGVFDPDSPLRANLGLSVGATWEPARGVFLSGAVNQKLIGTLGNSTRVNNSVLPRVRTDGAEFNRTDDPFIPFLTAEYFFRPGKNLYGRVSGGLLEREFGGVSGELLWKPVNSRLAIGVEVNRVRQRDFDMLFDFRDLDATTAFVSAYYDHGARFHSQVDVGQYLAGDQGLTYTLTREFSNGWEVGAFATRTNVSAAEFGEGSFDKGFTIRVPVASLLGRPSRQRVGTTIRPIQRDGGARLNIRNRLYDNIRDQSDPMLTEEWGRFWR